MKRRNSKQKNLKGRARAMSSKSSISSPKRGGKGDAAINNYEPDVILLDNDASVSIRGATSLTGEKVVNVSDGVHSPWVPLRCFTGSGSEGIEQLKANGLLILGSTKELCVAVGAITDYQPRTLVPQVGWTNGVFAEPGGRVFAPAALGEATAIFTPFAGVTSQGGTLEAWAEGIAAPLSKHPIGAFFLMAAFAGPLRPFTDLTYNPGYQLSGGAGKGKSTILQLMASVAGPAIDGPAGRYWITCNATVNGFETMMARHRHMAMVLEEAAMFNPSASAQGRAGSFVTLIFQLASGSAKTRHGDLGQESTQFVYAVSTNTSLLDVLKDYRDEVKAALCDRLLDIPLCLSRRFGTFERVPKGYRSAAQFATALVDCARDNYGVALPAFLAALVNARHEDEAALRRRIYRLVRRFRREIAADPNDGSAMRVVDAFGLVYAAGKLAVSYGVLPSRFNCRRAAVTCYHLHRAEGRPALSPAQRLTAWSERADVINLDDADLSTIANKQLMSAPGYWRTNREGQREFLLDARNLRNVFPDWSEARADGIARYLRRDKGRNKVKRALRRGGPKTWVYCFIYPERGWW